MGNLILISCSDKKTEGGIPLPDGADPVPWLNDSGLRNRLFDARAKVFGYVKENKLFDSKKSQGNRGRDPRNDGLVKGPDLGGGSRAGEYQPACIRYNGRFFRTIRGKMNRINLIEKWNGLRANNRVLIVSGLYGLVDPLDPIQEYTCHFEDRIIGSDSNLPLFWKEILTDIILDKFGDGKTTIIDLLSEEAYENAIDWRRIYRRNIKCLHRVYKLKAGPETLVNTALFFDDQFLLHNAAEFRVLPGKYISKEYFDDPQEKILFESQLKMANREVAREGLCEFEQKMKKRYGSIWKILSNQIRVYIANSEYIYERNKDLIDFDFTSASISLSKAIETWLEIAIVRPLGKIDSMGILLRNSRGAQISAEKASLGDVAQFLSSITEEMRKDKQRKLEVASLFPSIRSNDFKKIEKDLRNIPNKYRNGYAHKEPMPKELFEEFREVACEFFTKWVPVWK